MSERAAGAAKERAAEPNLWREMEISCFIKCRLKNAKDSSEASARSAEGRNEMWEAHLKLKFIGSWWKISLLCNLAKVLRLETQLYSGGTGRGEN